MLSDFTPIVHHLDGRTIKVWAVADVHIGAREALLSEWEAFLRKVEADPSSYLILDGDLLNNAVKSSCSDVYRETMAPSEAAEYAARVLQPVADRILAIVDGNHERRSSKEVDLSPLMLVSTMLHRSDGSNLLDVYRPNIAFIRIILGDAPRDTYAIMATHGKSQSRKRQFQSVVENVDAQIYAHTHQPDVTMGPARLRLTNRNNIEVHDVVYLTACSWVQAGGYSISGLYTPNAVARPQCLELEYTGTNSRKGRIKVVW